MLAAIGLFSVVVGAVAAYGAAHFPARAEALETGAGVLLIAGFALTGQALPAML